MKIIGLDLSTKCSGFSVFNEEGKLLDSGKIKPKTTLSTGGKITFIMREFYRIFYELEGEREPENEIKKVIIEDIFLNTFRGNKNQVKGFANLARLSGAIITVILLHTGKSYDDIIELRMANVARPIVGLKGSCQKAEVQVWVLNNFTDIDSSEYQALIDAVQGERYAKEITQKTYKDRMVKISKLIEKETDYGEDISDAILLGYGESRK